MLQNIPSSFSEMIQVVRDLWAAADFSKQYPNLTVAEEAAM